MTKGCCASTPDTQPLEEIPIVYAPSGNPCCMRCLQLHSVFFWSANIGNKAKRSRIQKHLKHLQSQCPHQSHEHFRSLRDYVQQIDAGQISLTKPQKTFTATAADFPSVATSSSSVSSSPVPAVANSGSLLLLWRRLPHQLQEHNVCVVYHHHHVHGAHNHRHRHAHNHHHVDRAHKNGTLSIPLDNHRKFVFIIPVSHLLRHLNMYMLTRRMGVKNVRWLLRNCHEQRLLLPSWWSYMYSSSSPCWSHGLLITQLLFHVSSYCLGIF